MSVAPPAGGGRPPIMPAIYDFPLPPSEVLLVTPTSAPSAIALLDMDDRLYMLKFEGAEMQLVEVDEDYIGQVSGGELSAVSPPPGANQCAYLQTRRLILYDLDAHTHALYRVGRKLEECGVLARWASVTPLAIVVQVRDTARFDDGILDIRLRSMALEAGESPLGALELGDANQSDFEWDAGRGLVTVVRDGVFEVHGLDLAKPLAHPLTEPAGELVRARGDIRGIRLHPGRDMIVLAFAEREPSGRPVISLWRATWGAGGTVLMQIAAIPDARQILLEDISPEGDWIAYRIGARGRTRVFIQKIGDPVGLPVELGAVATLRALLWTREPLSLVALEKGAERIVRWDLNHLRAP